MNKKKIILFLGIAFGISWLSAGICYVSGVQYGSGLSQILTATFYMCAPAAAAIIVQKLICKQPVSDLGLRLREARGWAFLRIPVLYLLICLAALGVVALFGNVLNIGGFGRLTFKDEEVLANLNQVMSSMGQKGLLKMPFPPAVLLTVQLISSLLVGAIVNTIFTLGEELGWRGFLYNEMKELGFWKSNLIIGVIWGIWHAPVILQGHNYPEHRILGVFLMVAFCVPLGYVMAYLRKRTKSVLAPAILHSGINAMGGNLMLYIIGGNDIYGGVAGFSGILACCLALGYALITDRKAFRNEAGQ
jgi:membrane protease YdiL (CAAX protease family)